MELTYNSSQRRQVFERSQSMKRFRARILIVFGVLVAIFYFKPSWIGRSLALMSSALSSSEGEDSHHSNKGYLAWKKGEGEFHDDYARFLNVDLEVLFKFRGMNESQIREHFSDLRGPNQANQYQTSYNEFIGYEEYFWIGDSAWTVSFKDGEFHAFDVWKG